MSEAAIALPVDTSLPINTSFSRVLPTLQLAWDGTSYSALKTCPRLYDLSIRQGYASRRENVHFTFGIYLHKAIELYDRRRAAGASHDEALHVVVRYALIVTWNFKLGRPWVTDEPTKNRLTLLRSIVWYLDQFEDDPLETVILANGDPAVELPFRLELGLSSSITNEPYLYCGHLDRVVNWNDRRWILDHKTTKYTLTPEYFAAFSPDNQMSGYNFAGQMIFDVATKDIIIDALQVGVGFTRCQRGFTSRTASQIDEWLHDMTYWLSQAERYASDGYWPQNDKSCYNCSFRPVCGSAPEIRQKLLDTMYVKRIWDPLVTREP